VLLASWSPPDGLNINMAAGAATQVLVATGSGHLVYLEVTQSGQLVEVSGSVKAPCL
jgi:hypothetical protein